MKTLTQERLKELLHYDPATGAFTRNTSVKGYAAGSRPGMINNEGYDQISVDGKIYRSHRLAWLYVYGELPAMAIDHINGLRADNRIANLRQVTPRENSHNRFGASSNNRSCGLLGVTWAARQKKFRARITTDGKHKNLGHFQTAEEAHQAYLAAKRELHAIGGQE